MRVCSICGEKNEDWMEICQRCGNSIVNATMLEKKEPVKVEPVVNNTDYNQNVDNRQSTKEKKPIANMDLILVLIVLLVILICLIFYTIHVIS